MNPCRFSAFLVRELGHPALQCCHQTFTEVGCGCTFLTNARASLAQRSNWFKSCTDSPIAQRRHQLGVDTILLVNECVSQLWH
mmetsp:Transcript_38424/g.63656  ORF Transcript_38424/g.63656 Transcript_38424/m.63656 type:complete len:83 (-) Transcript_38424:50-298(-)